MIKIAELLGGKVQTKVAADEGRVMAVDQPMSAALESQADNNVARYPAKNLVLDGGRYYAANNKK